MINARFLILFSILAAFGQTTTTGVDPDLTARCQDIRNYVDRTIKLDDLVSHLKAVEEQMFAVEMALMNSGARPQDVWPLSTLYVEAQRELPRALQESQQAWKAGETYHKQLTRAVKRKEAGMSMEEIEAAKKIAALTMELKQLHRDISNFSLARHRIAIQILLSEKTPEDHGMSTAFIPFEAINSTQCPRTDTKSTSD